MTERQIIFLNYLLKRLGFDVESEYSKDFVDQLSRVASVHKWIGVLQVNPEKEAEDSTYYDYDEDNQLLIPKKFDLIDYVFWEVKYRKEGRFIRINYNSDYISATDLSNFSYCAIGYSISKTFQLPKNQLAIIGTQYHEKQKLVSEFLEFEEKSKEYFYADTFEEKYSINLLDENVKHFFEELKESKLIFNGHKEEQEYFTNNELSYAGQPDYIFKSKTNKYFVVEEKFKRESDDYNNFFFHNHKVQLASYIYFLKEYKIDYGYLVYWTYSRFNPNEIIGCNILKIGRSSQVETYLFDVYKKVKDFRNQKYFNFSPEEYLKPKKCAGCVYILACGHKSKKYKQVTIPYQSSYQKLFYTPYPEELKSDDTSRKD